MPQQRIVRLNGHNSMTIRFAPVISEGSLGETRTVTVRRNGDLLTFSPPDAEAVALEMMGRPVGDSVSGSVRPMQILGVRYSSR